MEKSTRDKKEKDGLVKPVYEDRESQNSMVVQHEWSGSFKRIQHFHQFTDELEALCGLPSRDELPRILEVSNTSALPAIWRRARLSPLEEKAIAIFSVLAFSSVEHQLRWLREFFRREGWQIDLRGRPSLDPRDEDLVPLMRGLRIERIIARLEPGCFFKIQAKEKGGCGSDQEQIAQQLKDRGYDKQEVKAILEARSAQDAACRYFCATQSGVTVSCQSIRNDYAKFKLLKKRFPANFANSPGTPK